jgi:hypothetical protein
MVERSRNLCLYPNVYLMDQFGSQIRVLRPISVDKTEVTIYCIAPKGESDEARARRIRQYEDFFNVSGMATPDDLEEFRACQQGYAGSALEWNDMCRGSTHWVQGADEAAREIGLKPVMSGVRTEDEGLYTVQHRYWLDVMKQAIKAEGEANERTLQASMTSCAFLYRESRLLDDEQWDEWLECYHPDAQFWMPSWDDDDQLVTDPQREISLIYYPTRQGLEDRVFRIKTERSSATMPDTPHQPQHRQRRSRRCEQLEDARVHGALQLAHAEPPLQDQFFLLRHVALPDRFFGERPRSWTSTSC